MHSTVSDGTDTPEEILAKVKEAGLKVFSVTDHDAVKAGSIIRGLLNKDATDNPTFIQGAEFSCRDEDGKYHILGYGFDPDHEAIQRLIKHGHDIRIKKVKTRLDYLKNEVHIDFSDEEIANLLALDNPGKPHIANLMIKHGYAESIQNAMKEYLNKIRVKSEYIRPEEAIRSILEAGGIPVLAHPFYGSGDEYILGEEMEERMKKLVGYGILGLEAFYSGFSPKLQKNAIELANEYNLYITAGSDYHGTNKLVRLGDIGPIDGTECPEGLRRFLNKYC